LINAYRKSGFSALLARRGSANGAKTPDFVTGLVGGGSGFGWVDFDAALEVGAFSMLMRAEKISPMMEPSFLMSHGRGRGTLPTTFPETTNSPA